MQVIYNLEKNNLYLEILIILSNASWEIKLRSKATGKKNDTTLTHISQAAQLDDRPQWHWI